MNSLLAFGGVLLESHEDEYIVILFWVNYYLTTYVWSISV